MAAIVHLVGGYAKGYGKAVDLDVGLRIGQQPGAPDGGQVGSAVSFADPEFQLAMFAGLDEEDRIIQPAGGAPAVGNFLGGKLRNLTHDAAVEPVLRGMLGYIAEDGDFAGEPCIATLLNVMRDEVMQEGKHHHGAGGEGKCGPQRDAPGSAAHQWCFNGL